MLKCFFPTKYPYKTNLKTSYDLKISKFPQYNLDVPESFLNLFRLYSDEKDNSKAYTEYSYLKLEGKTYTITEVIWINDIFNHPRYKKLTNEYYNLVFFKKTYSKILDNINVIKIKSLKERKMDTTVAAKNMLTELLKQLDTVDRDREKNRDNKGDKTLIKTLIANISSFINEFGNIKNIEITDPSILDDIYNYITKIIENFDNYKIRLSKGYYNNPLFSMPQSLTDFLDEIKLLMNIIKDIRENLYIYKTYLNNRKLEKKILFDKKIGEENKKKLQKYINFFKEVDNFVNSNYATNNGYLQNCIDSFINNTNNDLITLIDPSHLKDVNKPDIFCNNYLKYLYSGVNVDVTNDFNEIFVRMDLIEGEVNDDNKKDIKCIYPGEKLTDKLDTLLTSSSKFWELNSRRMLFVLDEMKGYSKIGFNYPGEKEVADAKVSDAKVPDAKQGDAKVPDAKQGDAKQGDAKVLDAKQGDVKKAPEKVQDDDINPPFFNPLKMYGGGVLTKKNNTRKLKSYYIMN